MTLRYWVPFLLLLMVIGVLVRYPFVVALAASVLFVLAVAHWWQKHSLDAIHYRRRFHYTRSFPGETVALRIEIENRKILPLSWLRVEDPWPRPVGPQDESTLAPSHDLTQGYLVNLVSLRWFERARRAYTLLFRQRGVYQVGPARLQSGDLFGLYQRDLPDPFVERLTVFPRLLPPEALDLPAQDPFGDQRTRRRLFEDPNRPMGVREYHPEDEFRRVHWPATARTGQLQVKVYQPVSAQVTVICLNVATSPRPWEGVYPALQEHLLQVAATLVDVGLQTGCQVGMISNGCLANSDHPFRIPPSRSPRQLARLLESLAGVTPLVMAPFERFLLHEAPRLPYGATLVILTAVVTPELAETLLSLKRHERRVLLLSVAQEIPAPIPGIRMIHRPFLSNP